MYKRLLTKPDGRALTRYALQALPDAFDASLEDLVAQELRDKVRIVYDGPNVAAFMPICARYSYEVWIAPRRPAPSFPALTRDERRDFARALKTVTLKFDGLWNTPFPYILAFHQAPTDDAPPRVDVPLRTPRGVEPRRRRRRARAECPNR